MDKYLLCIGSNIDKVINMQKCRDELLLLYRDIEFSEIMETEPFGDGYVEDFLNQLVVVKTDYTTDTIEKQLAEIEQKLGRLTDDKSKGIVKIDIDLLAKNSTIIKHGDFRRPYMPLLLEKIDYPILIRHD